MPLRIPIRITCLVLCILFLAACNKGINEGLQEVKFARLDSLQRIDIYIGGTLFSSYWYTDSLEKPFLFPVNTAMGTTITRGFPLFPRKGERIDHPHHVGIWFNFGNVNGIDFWNNSFLIPEEKKSAYGIVKHASIDTLLWNGAEGVLSTTNNWNNAQGKTLLRESCSYHFQGNDSLRIITRFTTLTAADTTITLADNKEGLWAIRVDRSLEMPSNEAQVFTDANGLPTEVPVVSNEGVTGMYHGSNGLTGDSAWGTRNQWMMLSGKKGEEDIAIVLFDHPSNPGYPAHFHARGYGLFAINNIGQEVFRADEPFQSFTLKPGNSLQFAHRMIISSGNVLEPGQVDALYAHFIGLR